MKIRMTLSNWISSRKKVLKYCVMLKKQTDKKLTETKVFTKMKSSSSPFQ